MSFIRNGQESEYVDLHDGSRLYVYDHGSGIEEFVSYGAFAYALYHHVNQAEMKVPGFGRALEDHYGEKVDPDASYLGPKPEMAHIIAQHLDSRLDGFELKDEWLEQLREYAEEAYSECPACGDKWRPTAYSPDHQGNLCRECNKDRLVGLDVSADMSEALEYLEDEVPDRAAPEGFHDDEFYAKCMESFGAKEDPEKKAALQHQLGEASDIIQEAVLDEEPVDKEAVRSILERIHE